jgi:hypothetical protein
MHQRDVAALNKSLAAYKRLSSRCAAEIAELQLRCGWKAAALHAARKCQRLALGLPDSSPTPSELKAEKVGGLGPDIWLADIDGVDQYRWLSASTLRQPLRLKLSRCEPHRLRAIEAAEQRSRERGMEPSGDAA